MMSITAERKVLDDLVATTQKKVTELQTELAKLTPLQERLRFEARYLQDLESKRAALAVTPDRPKTNKKGSGASFEKGAIAPGGLTHKIIGVLKEEPGHESQAAQIARELTSQGVATTSKKGLLPMVISTLSRRKDVFEKVGRGRYKLRKQKESAI